MTEFRSLVMRAASASDENLAPYRNPEKHPIGALVAQTEEMLLAGKKKSGSGVPVGANTDEYETTCALRFISRCMVAADDPTGRDQDANTPRDDVRGNAEDFLTLAKVFSKRVCQTAVGLVAIDGIHRLVTVYGSALCDSESESAQAVDAVDGALQLIVHAVFVDLAVQELPTMSRRNALKALRWLVAEPRGWAAAVRCCREHRRKTVKQIGGTQDGQEERRRATGLWIATLTAALDEERDPVNVLALFEITALAHGYLLADFGATVLRAIVSFEHPAAKPDDGDGDDIGDAAEDASRSSGGSSSSSGSSSVAALLEAIEGFFAVAAGYFPLQFAPAPGSAVKKETLVAQLHAALALPLFTYFTLPLVLNKLDNAASTATMLQCLDVLSKSIEQWRAIASHTTTVQHLPRYVMVCATRRFLKELFPFFRTFIMTKAAASDAVAERVASALSDAAAAYDATYHHSTSSSPATPVPYKAVLECPSVTAVLAAVPSASADPTSVLLDASLAHAVGRSSPLLAIVLGAAVLPLVAGEPARLPTTAAIFANFEMNSAPPAASSTTTTETANIGDANSPKAVALRQRVALDDGALRMMRHAFQSALDVASALIIASADENAQQQHPADMLPHLVRSAADTIASGACLRQRQLPFACDVAAATDEDSSASSSSGGSFGGVPALLDRWGKHASRRFASDNDTDDELLEPLSSAASVCLAVNPAACSSTFQHVCSSSAARVASAMHLVLRGSVSQFPSAAAFEVLASCVMLLRQNAVTEDETNGAVARIDRLCLVPLADVVTSKLTSWTPRLLFFLQQHAAQIEKSAPAAVTALAELLFFVSLRVGRDALKSDVPASNPAVHSRYNAVLSLLQGQQQNSIDADIVASEDETDAGRFLAVTLAATSELSMQQAVEVIRRQKTSSHLHCVAACNLLRLKMIAASGNADDVVNTLVADGVVPVLNALSDAAQASACLADALRPAGAIVASSWEAGVASAILSAILSGSNQRALAHATALLRALKGGNGSNNTFTAALVEHHKALLSKIQLQPDADGDADADADASFVDDCMTCLEWLLLLEAPRLAALDFLLLGASSGSGSGADVLLQLCDAATEQELAQRERPLRILREVGGACLALSVDKDPRWKAGYEGAVKPVVPVIAKRLQACLGDKKRIVRSLAGEARHLWLLLPKWQNE